MSATTTVPVKVPGHTYDIVIGEGILPTLPERLGPLVPSRRILVVSDDNVAGAYGRPVTDALTSAGYEAALASIPAGESSKSGDQLFTLYDKALDHGLDRKSTIVAVGGGVVGDLAGYLAASYLRGIHLIQVPTTLLAMVDSSVGGKTGINLPRGKNLVGAFYQPRLVLADTGVLTTLPDRELRAGLAEVIKYGVIRDPDLFALLEASMPSLLDRDNAWINRIVSRSCEIKAEVVAADEKESGLRSILNFGHTLGHAVEAVTGYTTYLHGEAIAVGMAFAARLSGATTGLSGKDITRLESLIEKTGLPVRAPDLSWEDLATVMKRDKKSVAGIPKFVLAETIGRVRFGIDVDPGVAADVWAGMAG